MKKWLILLLVWSLLSLLATEVQFSVSEKYKRIVDDIPVQPGQRLRITITARTAKGNCVENLPQIADFLDSAVWSPQSLPFKLPFICYEFRTTENKLRRNELYSPKRITVESNEFRDYILEFYVPDEAAFLRLIGHANGPENTLEVKSYNLETCTEKYVNINSDFNLSIRNPSGFYLHQAQVNIMNNGMVEVSQSWGISDYIPVIPDQRFRVSFSGKAPGGKRMNFSTIFYPNTAFKPKEAIGKNKIPMFLRGNQTEGSAEVTIPEGARWMRLGTGNGIIRYFRVETINGEEK